MTLPLFTLFEPARYERLWSALRAMGPREAHRIMQALAAQDVIAFDEQAAAADRSRAQADKARAAMTALPAIPRRDIEAAARRFGGYGPRMQIDATFITLWLNDPRLLFQVVEVRGLENLLEAARGGRGVLALPLHLGASYVVPSLLAHFCPTRLVFNRMNVKELRRLSFPDLDLVGYPLSDDLTFRRGLEALRAGHVFAMFPEYDPRGQRHRHEVVPFLGGRIAVPQGPVILSASSGAPMLPVHLDSSGDGRHVLHIHRPVTAPRGDSERCDALHEVWALIERLLLDGRLGDWEIWAAFESMRAEQTP